jgi:hypothetical protein
MLHLSVVNEGMELGWRNVLVIACSNCIVLHTACWLRWYNIIAAEARLDLALGGRMKKSLVS